MKADLFMIHKYRIAALHVDLKGSYGNENCDIDSLDGFIRTKQGPNTFMK